MAIMTPSQVLAGIAHQLRGAAATDNDLRILTSRLPANFLPDWFASLLAEYKLGGVDFSLSKNDDCSGFGAEMIWLTAEQMVSEAIEVEPGISVVTSGFLPVGGCALGSGDPYFLDLREGSDDPPVVRVPHDFAGGATYPLDRIELVARSLSEFFSHALSKAM
jgi:hypothetical protein